MTPDQLRQVWGAELSMIFQDPMTALNPVKRIGKQITESLRLHVDMDRKEAVATAIELLRSVGIPSPEERIRWYPFQLSGGMRQRVMIAIALACAPRLVMADEPTTGLDVTVQAQILDLLADLQRERHMAVILVTHDLGVVANRADDIVVMYAGRIVEQAPTRTLFHDTHMPYTRALMDSIPRLADRSGVRLNAIAGRPPDLIHPPPGCRFAPRCPYVQDKCRDSEPPLRTAGSAEHLFACWYPAGQRHADVSGGHTDGQGSGGRGPGRGGGGGGPGRARWFPSTGAALARRGDRRRRTGHRRGGPAVTEAPTGPPVAPGQSGPFRTSDASGQNGDGDGVVLTTDRLVVEFRSGRQTVQAVSGVTFSVRSGRDAGAGRRVGLREVDHRPGPGPGAGAHVGHGRPTRVRTWPSSAAGSCGRVRTKIQMIFQDPISSLNPRRRVRDIVAEPLNIWGRGTKKERAAKVREMLEAVGIDPDTAGDRRPQEFSGGQCQRISIARALMAEPDLLICDEPVSALDVSVQAQILNLLADLKQQFGLTMVFIAHDLAVVKNVSDRVAVMYLGKLVEIAESDELYRAAAHPYTEALLASIPEPDPDQARPPQGA